MTGGDRARVVRVGDRIREELVAILLRGKLRDPRLAGTEISRVEVSGDLRHARVFVRTLSARAATDAERRQVVDAFTRAAGFLRREIAPELAMKHTPELVFEWDRGFDNASRVTAILEEIRRDEEEKP